MNELKTPELHEFLLRDVPVDVAYEAQKNWETLTQAEREALGFRDDYSPLTDYLRQKGASLQGSPIVLKN